MKELNRFRQFVAEGKLNENEQYDQETLTEMANKKYPPELNEMRDAIASLRWAGSTRGSYIIKVNKGYGEYILDLPITATLRVDKWRQLLDILPDNCVVGPLRNDGDNRGLSIRTRIPIQ